MNEQRSVFKAVGAGATLLFGVVGVPLALATQSGWPLPFRIPNWDAVSAALTQTSVSDEVILQCLAVACWLVWAIFALTVVEETVVVVSGTNRRFVSVGPLQVFVASLIGAIVLSIPTSQRTVVAEPTFSLAVATQTASASSSVSAPAPTAVVAPASSAQPTTQYTVVRRDTLWGIASQHLGDGTRWREIWNLNQGKTQSDGRVFNNESKIHPGWVLDLPSEATTSVTPVAPADMSEPEVVEQMPEAPVAPSLADTPVMEEVAPSVSIDANDEIHDPQTIESADRQAGIGIALASGGIVGITLATGISAALVTARLRRRRTFDPGAVRLTGVVTDPLLTDDILRMRHADLNAKALLDEPDDVVPAMAHRPGSVTVAIDGDNEVVHNVSGSGGLRLEGEHKLDAARALIVGFISNQSPLDAEVVVVGHHLAEELALAHSDFPSFAIDNDVDAVLTSAEQAIVERQRLLAEGDYDEVNEFRRMHPIESVPARLIVLGSVDDEVASRAAGVASAGAKLDVSVLFVTDSNAGVLTLSSNETSVSTITVDGHSTELGVPVRMSEPAAFDSLNVLDAARSEAPVAELRLVDDSSGAKEDIEDSGPQTTRVELKLFGPCRVLIDGAEPLRQPRKQVRELLAFLATRTHGATADVAGEAIWPGSNHRRVVERIRNLHGSVNRDLRELTGTDGDFIERAGERYRLNAGLIRCDWWDFDLNSVNELVSVPDDELCSGEDWIWVEFLREQARRSVLSALLQRAKTFASVGRPEDALVELRRALELDPYNEAVTQDLMRTYAALSRPVDVEWALSQLEDRLANDLKSRPAEATYKLRDALLVG